MKKNIIHIEGVKSETVSVKVELETLLHTLKREVYRPLRIDSTAFVDTDDKIKIWEYDYRNNYTEEDYEVTFEQNEIIRAFCIVEKYLQKAIDKR